MRAGMIALVVSCALAGALASTSANAIVTLSSQYIVGPMVNPNAGVNVGDVVTVEAYYDPLFANFEYQDSTTILHSFDTEHAGLRFTVGELVWESTGPLTLQTWVERRDGNVISASIDFLANTNALSQGHVSGSMTTPWNVTGESSMSFFRRFHASGEVTGPQLFDESYFGSILQPMTRHIMGGARADTAAGSVNFNFHDPAALGLPPVSSVPEPGTLGLFALGAAGMLFRRGKNKKAAA